MKIIMALALMAASSIAIADQYVQGHTRSDGTYVQGYNRSSPNSTKADNYSNTNPYTGNQGTQNAYGNYQQPAQPSNRYPR